MRVRESREREEEAIETARAQGAPDGGADLDAARRAGERLLAAGDAAIARALSGDSERFLAANRQQGGE
jgi:hypothetical protein